MTIYLYARLSQDHSQAECQQCRHSFDILDRSEKSTCPNCQAPVTVPDVPVSVSAQRDKMLRYLQAQAAAGELDTSQPVEFVWEICSASIPMRKRDRGGKILHHLQPGDQLIATKLDRCFRNVRDAHHSYDIIANKKAKLTILQFANMPENMQALMFSILSWMAEFEYNVCSERRKDNNQHRRDKGLAVTSSPPLGYKLAVNSRGERVYKPDHTELRMLAHVRQWRSMAISHQDIRDSLNNEGFRNRAGLPITMKQIEKYIPAAEKLHASGKLPACTIETPSVQRKRGRPRLTPRARNRPQFVQSSRPIIGSTLFLPNLEPQTPVANAGPLNDRSDAAAPLPAAQ
jgi:DNA invertase Pin-like site-specific DNA recombinase